MKTILSRKLLLLPVDNPCLHSDPVLPDCAPGETVRARGRLWFHEGRWIEEEIERALTDF